MRAILIILLGAATVLSQPLDVNLDSFTEGNVDFISKTYKELLKTKSGNFLVCPLSVRIATAFAYAGAKGTTAKELADGINVPDDKTKIQDLILKLSTNLQTETPYTLTNANKVYITDRIKIKEQFKNTAVNVFRADIQNINFVKNEEAAAEINKWVEQKTFNKIKDLISSDILDQSTVAVLVNAMYFKGTWLEQFDPRFTSKSDFFVTENDTVKVDMMKIRSYFNFYNNAQLDAKFLEMLFEGDDVTMTFVLPNKKHGLTALEKQIGKIFAKQPYTSEDTEVYLPKFTVESQIDFKAIFKSLGVETPFRIGAADFSEMVDQNHPIFISDIVQKTFIEVNEKGATAAASTAVVDSYMSDPLQAFEARHPFLFFLKHTALGVFFVGRCTNPQG